jgi:DNA polymerase/3'-5' exonuclease PolX
MLSNDDIAAAFERVADLLEVQGASAHRVRAWRRGAQAVGSHLVDCRSEANAQAAGTRGKCASFAPGSEPPHSPPCRHRQTD